jgi:hypothetical protein
MIKGPKDWEQRTSAAEELECTLVKIEDIRVNRHEYLADSGVAGEQCLVVFELRQLFAQLLVGAQQGFEGIDERAGSLSILSQ